MSRTILKSRPPVSPNKPPPAPMKIPYKGNPIPIDVNLLITGSTVEQQHQQQNHHQLQQQNYHQQQQKYHHHHHQNQLQKQKKEDKSQYGDDTSKGIAQVTNLQTFTPCLDKQMLQSLIRPTSVDDSFYDRFERLERDYVQGDVAIKEKVGRVKSAGNVFTRLTSAPPRTTKVPTVTSRLSTGTSRVSSATSRVSSATSRVSSATSRVSSATSRASSATSRGSRVSSATSHGASTVVSRVSSSKRERKRPKSAPTSRKNTKVSTGTFFDLAISLDDETRQNTITNAESKTDIKYLGIEHVANKSRPNSARSKVRPRSGRRLRERSRSRRRSCVEGYNESKAFNKRNSERSSHTSKVQQNTRVRNSRSRTRLDSKDPKGDNAAKKQNSTVTQRSISNVSKKHRKIKVKEDKVSLDDSLYTNVVPSPPIKHVPTPPKTIKTIENSAKCQNVNGSAIDIVSEANDVKRTVKRLEEKGRVLYNGSRRYSSSCLPKLKMIVAPSALPLASLVRKSSAKMLINNAHIATPGTMKETAIT